MAMEGSPFIAMPADGVPDGRDQGVRILLSENQAPRPEDSNRIPTTSLPRRIPEEGSLKTAAGPAVLSPRTGSGASR